MKSSLISFAYLVSSSLAVILHTDATLPSPLILQAKPNPTGSVYNVTDYFTYPDPPDTLLTESDLQNWKALNQLGYSFTPISSLNPFCKFVLQNYSLSDLKVFDYQTGTLKDKCNDGSDPISASYIHVNKYRSGFSIPIPYSPCYDVPQSTQEVVPSFLGQVIGAFVIDKQNSGQLNLQQYSSWLAPDTRSKVAQISRFDQTLARFNSNTGKAQLKISFRLLEMELAFQELKLCTNENPTIIDYNALYNQTIYYLDVSNENNYYIEAFGKCDTAPYTNSTYLNLDESAPHTEYITVFDGIYDSKSCYIAYQNFQSN